MQSQRRGTLGYMSGELGDLVGGEDLEGLLAALVNHTEVSQAPRHDDSRSDDERMRELVSYLRVDPPPIEIDGREAVTQAEALEVARSLWPIHERIDLSGIDPELHRNARPIAIGWWHSAFRQNEAAVRLVDGAMPDVAFTNARSAFDHALHLSAMALCLDDGCLQEFLDAIEANFVRSYRLAVRGYETIELPGGSRRR